MQLAQVPELVQLPFADSGTKNSIPTPSQVSITPGAASLTTGFPPITFLDPTAGGIPPFGADFNGILNLISANTRWENAGAFYPYDATFSSFITGYPKGAILSRADGTGFWLSTADDNTANPETDTTGAWVPVNNQGVTAITGLTNANVTLTALQYSKRVITLAGTLTGNVQIIFPAIKGLEWTVINNTTGAFTITCKTSAGTGVPVAKGAYQNIYSDGANINYGYPSVTQIQSNALNYCTDTGTANAYAGALSPAPAALTPGMIVTLGSIVASNTGASTLNISGLGALPIQSAGGVALQGGELVAGYGALFQINKAATAAILIQTTGGSLPVKAATKSKHAVNLGQARTVFQANGSDGSNKIAITGDYTLTQADSGKFLDAWNAPAGTVITLPFAGTGFAKGWNIEIGPNNNALTINNPSASNVFAPDNKRMITNSGGTWSKPIGIGGGIRINEFANAAVAFATGRTIVAPAVNANEAVNLAQLASGDVNIGNKSVFTANGTFTVPANVTKIWVSAAAGGGGGGGGGGAAGTSAGSGGGGGGAGQSIQKSAVTVTPADSISITVGAAGAGGTVSGSGGDGTAGSAGGNTIIGAITTLTGGAGGEPGLNSSAGGGFGGVGYPAGSDGQDVNSGTQGTGSGGPGASSPFGGGGGLGRSGNGGGHLGYDAFGYGSGGGGGGGSVAAGTGNGGNGGNGAPGIVIIEW